MHKKILEFIKNFKRQHNKNALVECFTEGNCYHFALILKTLFPMVYIIHDDENNHFMVMLNISPVAKFYDITGEITIPNKITLFSMIENDDNKQYDILLRDCVYKINYYPFLTETDEWYVKLYKNKGEE